MSKLGSNWIWFQVSGVGPNQAIPIGANVEISPKGFTLGASVSFTREFLPNFDP
jgi:hypothetical protein